MNLSSLNVLRKKKILFASVIFLQILGSCADSDTKSSEDDPKDKQLENGSSQQYIILNGIDASQEAFQEIDSIFGKSNDSKTAIGVAFIISYLNDTPKETAGKLKKYLTLSERFDMPIVVQLDGEQWWGNRPDLWNWWDENKEGYDPENKKNVEWTNWSPDSAVKIGWRDWGRQLRVDPMPNLMSPAYREASHVEMKKLVPIVMDWWKSLPEDKKDLLVGIKVGWESAIGVNNWYYPDGNDLLNELESEDPQYGLEVDSLPDRGVEAIGYAAVSTLGIASSGELKEAQVSEVVQVHLEDLSKLSADMGVPRERLFTHAGGWSEGENLFTAAVNKYSSPGWSFYDHAIDPKNDKTAMEAVKASDARYWSAVEWLFDGETKGEWMSALKNTLSDPKMKYVNIYNWSGIRDNQAAKDAIRTISESK